MANIATIGFFDGVHLGHCFLLQHLQKEATARGLESIVITFTQHPRSVLSETPQLLTTPEERKTLLIGQGVEQVVMLDFAAVRSLTARVFMERLYAEYDVHCLLLGYDHHFGSDCLSSFADYQRIGREVGIEVVQMPEYTNEGVHVSSTTIRKALLAGDVEQANQLLGYRYTLQGNVVAGRQIGREIGFPTANIALSEDKLVPRQGVWVVDVTGIAERPLRGLLNIGNNPTVGGETTTFEVHILDYTGDLYDCHLSLQLLHFIRPEQKFDSLAALQKQIADDIRLAKSTYL